MAPSPSPPPTTALWLAGEAGRRQSNAEGEADLEGLALNPQRSANGQVLGCLPLDARGFLRRGQRLRCNTTNREDALTACGDRVLLGVRGPVLHGIALVVELHIAGPGHNKPEGLQRERIDGFVLPREVG